MPDVSIRQTVEGIPNGKYRMRAGAGNIQQAASGSTVNAGTKQTGAILYADLYEVPVDTMKASKEIYFTVVDGKTTLGFQNRECHGNWVCLDNFRLYYLGEYMPKDYAAYLAHYAGYVRNNLLTKRIQTTVRLTAETAVENAERLSASDVPDEEAMAAAKASLDHAVAEIEASARCMTNWLRR